jgi:hypothetical protein
VEQKRNAFRLLMGESKERRLFGRLTHRWEDNIKMDLREKKFGCELYSPISGQEPVEGSCEYSNEHSVSMKYS